MLATADPPKPESIALAKANPPTPTQIARAKAELPTATARRARPPANLYLPVSKRKATRPAQRASWQVSFRLRRLRPRLPRRVLSRRQSQPICV